MQLSRVFLAEKDSFLGREDMLGVADSTACALD